mgnify:CR=1 FL=1
MAYVNHTSAHHGFSAGLADFVAHVRESLARRRIYRQTVSELSQLSDRELSDLQLNRSSIQAVAREAAYN